MDLNGFLSSALDEFDRFTFFLPCNYQEKAYELEAFCRRRNLQTPAQLLRLILINTFSFSLQETCLRAPEMGVEGLQPGSLFRRMCRAEAWMAWLVEQAWSAGKAAARLKGCRVLLADASSLSGPGSAGPDYRMHCALEAFSLRCDQVYLGEAKPGETFRHFHVRRKEIWLGDAVYGNPAGVAHVTGQKGHVVVRYNPKSLPLYTGAGEPIPLEGWLGSIQRRGRFRADVIGPGGQRIRGRLLIRKRSPEAAERACQRLRRRARHNQSKVPSEEALLWAGYVMVWTSLGREWTAREIWQLYRMRWQVELLFKRLKSVVGMDRLPKKRKDCAKVWLYGKLLLALLVEKFIAVADAPVPKKKRPTKRSRWKETALVLREFFFCIVPRFGLVKLLKYWKDMVQRLAKSVLLLDYQLLS